MKSKVYSHELLIGSANLKVGDISMGCVYGTFEPTGAYFEKIQKHVWDFWEAKKPNYELWYSFRFNVQLENGLFLFPRGGYTFDDTKKVDNEPIRMDLAGLDYQIIEDYFITQPIRTFVEEPWCPISVTQKIAFENELKLELGKLDLGKPSKSFLELFKKKSLKHMLSGAEYSAFCHDQRNDDVLFEINKAGDNEKFAVTYLTWSGRKESEGYPITNFFKDFDEFKYLRMNEDKIDWED
ncbi:MAG: hypothetical protein ACJASQ_000439 [Crocinitomicaceae bacterium]